MGRKRVEPREKQKHLTRSQAELGLSHMARAGFELTLDTAVRTLGTSPIKWGQSPDMTIAVDYNVKHQFKQTALQVKDCGIVATRTHAHTHTHTSNKILRFKHSLLSSFRFSAKTCTAILIDLRVHVLCRHS